MGGPFIRHNGPLYARLLDGRLELGFRVEERHTNPLKICHGGMLATLADMLLPMVALYGPQDGAERRFFAHHQPAGGLSGLCAAGRLGAGRGRGCCAARAT
jgi:uncharacterized protein (TIGR00369 family)